GLRGEMNRELCSRKGTRGTVTAPMINPCHARKQNDRLVLEERPRLIASRGATSLRRRFPDGPAPRSLARPGVRGLEYRLARSREDLLCWRVHAACWRVRARERGGTALAGVLR